MCIRRYTHKKPATCLNIFDCFEVYIKNPEADNIHQYRHSFYVTYIKYCNYNKKCKCCIRSEQSACTDQLWLWLFKLFGEGVSLSALNREGTKDGGDWALKIYGSYTYPTN